jgi:hypothetical protein
MLLSYGKPATVSSYDNAERYPASAITDESLRSYWAAASGNPGEWVIVDLESPKTVQAIQVNYYDHKAQQFDRANDIYHQYRIFASENGEDWTLVIDKSDNDRDVPHDYVELQSPLRARYIKLENLHMPTGNFALSGLRVFGSAEGVAPAAVKKLKVDRDKTDPRNAMISWTPVDGAYGYNIYYGIAPDKLYNAITVYGDTQYDMRGLDRTTEYYFSIEALGESGRSPLSKVVNK